MGSCCPVSMRHRCCRLKENHWHFTLLVKPLTVATVHHILVIGLFEMHRVCDPQARSMMHGRWSFKNWASICQRILDSESLHGLKHSYVSFPFCKIKSEADIYSAKVPVELTHEGSSIQSIFEVQMSTHDSERGIFKGISRSIIENIKCFISFHLLQ